jgi:hypothetical protein
MKNWRTTLFGSVTAAATAVSQVEGIPPKLKSACILVIAVAGALFAFFCADAPPSQTTNNQARLFVLALPLAAALLAGCTMMGFRLTVSNPSIGTATLAIGGGAIGAASTNCNVMADVCAVATNTNATH